MRVRWPVGQRMPPAARRGFHALAVVRAGGSDTMVGGVLHHLADVAVPGVKHGGRITDVRRCLQPVKEALGELGGRLRNRLAVGRGLWADAPRETGDEGGGRRAQLRGAVAEVVDLREPVRDNRVELDGRAHMCGLSTDQRLSGSGGCIDELLRRGARHDWRKRVEVGGRSCQRQPRERWTREPGGSDRQWRNGGRDGWSDRRCCCCRRWS